MKRKVLNEELGLLQEFDFLTVDDFPTAKEYNKQVISMFIKSKFAFIEYSKFIHSIREKTNEKQWLYMYAFCESLVELHEKTSKPKFIYEKHKTMHCEFATILRNL